MFFSGDLTLQLNRKVSWWVKKNVRKIKGKL